MHHYYTITALKSPRTCRFCRHSFNIELTEPVTALLDDLSDSIAEAINGEAEALGWVSGACPECAHENASGLAAEQRADERMEVAP
jgi:hypothetical protein